jgi:predicted RNA-binding protein YlxR (DUF448 family)
VSNSAHIPMRMCAVTREKLPKKDLLRFVLTEEGKLVLDKGEKVRGRGLNMKPDISIFDLSIKRKVFERMLSAKLTPELILKLREEVQDYIDRQFRPKQVVRVNLEQIDKLSSK